MFQLFDYYAVSGYTMLWSCCWECICVTYLFGKNNIFYASSIININNMVT